jgi:hypothetical protein
MEMSQLWQAARKGYMSRELQIAESSPQGSHAQLLSVAIVVFTLNGPVPSFGLSDLFFGSTAIRCGLFG